MGNEHRLWELTWRSFGKEGGGWLAHDALHRYGACHNLVHDCLFSRGIFGGCLHRGFAIELVILQPKSDCNSLDIAGRCTFLMLAQSVISDSSSSGASVPSTTLCICSLTSPCSRSGEPIRTTIKDLLASATPYRRIASVIYVCSMSFQKSRRQPREVHIICWVQRPEDLGMHCLRAERSLRLGEKSLVDSRL